MEYLDVRNQYPEFYYHDFVILESDDEFHVQFDFEIRGLSHFNPDFIVPKPSSSIAFGNLRTVREAAFSLGLIELVSYWKLTCSPLVIIECGALDSEQTAWWKKLYFNGLSAFFSNNHIDADPETFMDLRSAGDPITGHVDQRRFCGNLIPVGGGKGSAVCLDLLSGMKDNNHAFVINHVMSAVRSAQAAGYSGEKLIIAERSIDSRMLEFNKAGFLNGPTPYSALSAFAASLTAAIYGIQNICMSNVSAETQREQRFRYSESYEFEQEFKHYMDTCISPEIHYFSLLRPLDSLQITGLFSVLEQYHPVFISCPSGRKEERWCGHCATCLYECVLLSAFLSDEKLCEIFGTDILNDEGMTGLFLILTEPADDKPAEFIGTEAEMNTAAAISVRHHEESGKPLPLLYRIYKNSPAYEIYRGKQTDWSHYDTENLVPKEYQELLQRRLREMKKQ